MCVILLSATQSIDETTGVTRIMGRTRRKHGSGAAVDFGTEDTRNTLEKQVFDEYKRRTSVVKIIIILAVILAIF